MPQTPRCKIQISHQTLYQHYWCFAFILSFVFFQNSTSSLLLHKVAIIQWPKFSLKRQKASDLESDDILSVDLADVMFSQQTVASSRAILDQWGDFTGLVDKSHVAWAVFVHGDGALEWPEETHTDTNNALIHRHKGLMKTNRKGTYGKREN